MAGCRTGFRVGVLTRGFSTPELVGRGGGGGPGAREQRRRACCRRGWWCTSWLALWLFRGPELRLTGQVMIKLADGLYHQRRAADLLEGQPSTRTGWVDAGEGPARWAAAETSPRMGARAAGKLGPVPLKKHIPCRFRGPRPGDG